jgi:hypothetical protein
MSATQLRAQNYNKKRKYTALNVNSNSNNNNVSQQAVKIKKSSFNAKNVPAFTGMEKVWDESADVISKCTTVGVFWTARSSAELGILAIVI